MSDSRERKLIVTDVDGVLLDWNYAFEQWMRKLGHVKGDTGHMYNLESVYSLPREEIAQHIVNFNLSAHMAFVPPLRDAVKYVKKLHEECGFIFHCVTSMNADPYANRLRRQNLRALFGNTVFEKITCLPLGASKSEALSEYADSGCLWVEDHVGNAQVGEDLGMGAILIAHDYNISKPDAYHNFIRYDGWKQIFQDIKKPPF